jgi:hypothetical protein
MKVDRITLENYASGRPRDDPNLGRARIVKSDLYYN